MAITNCGTLKTAITDWMARSDLSASALADFVTFATDLFNYGSEENNIDALRCRDMESVEDLTPSSGICTLPTDYLQYRRVVEKVSPRRNLKFITPDEAENLFPSRFGGLGSRFTIIGSSLYTFPLVSNTVELTFYEKLTPLSADGDTNWLLSKHPQAYLKACLLSAWDYVRDNEEMAKSAQFTRSFVAGLNRTNVLANYARAGLAINGPTP